MGKFKTVLAFGTYDVFHSGHIYFLTEAKALGDRLVVVVARDANVEQIKHFLPHDTETVRLDNVQQCPAVDRARLGYEAWDKHLQVLEDVQPDVIALGYDQQAKLPDGPWQVVRLPAFKPEQYKSSLIKQEMKNTP